MVTFFSGIFLTLSSVLQALWVPDPVLYASYGLFERFWQELAAVSQAEWAGLIVVNFLSLLLSPALALGCNRYFLKLLDGKECPYFFVSTRGNQMKTDAMRKMFKATVREAGLDDSLSPHDMRHTFATDLLNGGADLRSVQEMLGHAQLSTTQVYTHLSVERLKKVHDQALPR